MEVEMVTKKTMEVYVTNEGNVFKDYKEAVEHDKKERIIDLLKRNINNKYYFMDSEYEIFSEIIYCKFDLLEDIFNKC